MNIVILGSGNVATHLGKALDHAGYNILQIWSRSMANAKNLANKLNAEYTDDLATLNFNADLYIISVVDDAINDLVERLKQLSGGLKAMLVHTSGSTPMSVLHGGSDKFGVFYPLQTFSKAKDIDFKEIPLLIEASDAAQLDLLQKLASSISNRVEVATSSQRKSLHIAAVFACNYTNYLYSVAQQLLEEYKLDFNLIRPLIRETADKIQLHNPQDVQTGPAIRNDLSVLKDHMEFLKDRKEWQKIYKLLSEQLVTLSTHK